MSPTFKESPPPGWKEAQPADGQLKGNWWEMYGDPGLNALEEQVNISNQSVLAAEALYREAREAVRVARSNLFPVVGGALDVRASRAGTAGGNFSSNPVRSFYSLPLQVSWAPDLWGSVRRSVTAASATAQASAAELENARLLIHAELAQDYFQLRGIDTEADLLRRTVASYQEFLQLTRDRFNAGVASDLDVAQAESQLYGAQSQLIDLGVERAALEHAIAVLTGKPPAEVTVPAGLLHAPPPPVPLSVPSALLERRPDIAAAERRVAAANEQIGIAQAAFFPALNLAASIGYQATDITKWFSAPSRIWSVGPALAQTLFEGGRRRAQVAISEAAYDVLVADYRQSVLTALQQVEDNLAALRQLNEEADKVAQTIAAANRSLSLSTLQYKAGTTSFLQVITAQATALAAQRSAVLVQSRRYVANVLLIQALGGGWSTAQLPK